MNVKLQELTDKIYAEGVEKGKQEAETIVSKAREEAAEIMDAAQKQADAIVAEAQRAAAETDQRMRSELRLYADQAVGALKTEITNLLSDQLVRQCVDQVFEDKNFVQGLVAKMCEQWAREGNVTLETADADALTQYFMQHAHESLQKGVQIREVKGAKTNFSIHFAEKGYKINFGEEEFMAYFKTFLRPKLIEILF